MTKCCTCKAEHWQPHTVGCPAYKPPAALSSVSTLRLLATCGSMDLSMLGPIADEMERLQEEIAGLKGQAFVLKTANAAKDVEIQRLQRALSFWMPCVPDPGEVMAGACERLMDDAMLMAGYDGVDEKSAEALGWVRLVQPTAHEPGAYAAVPTDWEKARDVVQEVVCQTSGDMRIGALHCLHAVADAMRGTLASPQKSLPRLVVQEDGGHDLIFDDLEPASVDWRASKSEAAPPDLWTCDECAGPPRPYEEVQCVLGKCKPVRT